MAEKARPSSEAEEVLNEFQAALAALGIVLPSLYIDHVSEYSGRPLIDLGRANLETVRRLTKALRAVDCE